jgi:hypothetical protein
VPYVTIVLPGAEAEKLLGSEEAIQSFLKEALLAFGSVSFSLLMIGFERYLVSQGRRIHDAAIRSGAPIHRKSHMQRVDNAVT